MKTKASSFFPGIKLSWLTKSNLWMLNCFFRCWTFNLCSWIKKNTPCVRGVSAHLSHQLKVWTCTWSIIKQWINSLRKQFGWPFVSFDYITNIGSKMITDLDTSILINTILLHTFYSSSRLFYSIGHACKTSLQLKPSYSGSQPTKGKQWQVKFKSILKDTSSLI